jgi:hypothetical protein
LPRPHKHNFLLLLLTSGFLPEPPPLIYLWVNL